MIKVENKSRKEIADIGRRIGEEVLVGSSAFMNLRGVRLTEARDRKSVV